MWTQAFLGQKYGYRPFPPKIAADEFEAIRRELATEEGAWSLLDTWFRKDTNSVPNVYVLQPISSVLPDYADMVSTSISHISLLLLLLLLSFFLFCFYFFLRSLHVIGRVLIVFQTRTDFYLWQGSVRTRIRKGGQALLFHCKFIQSSGGIWMNSFLWGFLVWDFLQSGCSSVHLISSKKKCQGRFG